MRPPRQQLHDGVIRCAAAARRRALHLPGPSLHPGQLRLQRARAVGIGPAPLILLPLQQQRLDVLWRHAANLAHVAHGGAPAAAAARQPGTHARTLLVFRQHPRPPPLCELLLLLLGLCGILLLLLRVKFVLLLLRLPRRVILLLLLLLFLRLLLLLGFSLLLLVAGAVLLLQLLRRRLLVSAGAGISAGIPCCRLQQRGVVLARLAPAAATQPAALTAACSCSIPHERAAIRVLT